MRSLRFIVPAALLLGAAFPVAAVGSESRFHPPGYKNCGVIRVAYDAGGHARYRVFKRHTRCRRAKRIVRNFYGGRTHLIRGAGPEYASPHAVRGGWRCGVAGGGVSCFKRHHRHPKPRLVAVYLN